ncbi:MAG: RNA polymerase sigma factor [Armatimonadota bacterium]
MTPQLITEVNETEPAAGMTPDAGARVMLSGLRQRIGSGASATPSEAPVAPKRESNRELLDKAMNATAEWQRNRAAETLRRQIKTLCAAVVDRHTSALTSQEVEDLTQEVFLRLLTSQAGNIGEAVVDPTPAYIARIAVNLLIDRRRFLKRRGLDQIPASVEDEVVTATLRDPNPSVEDAVLGRLRTRELRRALLKSLSPTEAKVVWMRTEGASHEEIARELNIKEPNARKHCERGLKRLKNLVETNAIPLMV